jgi:hypothetical protein
VYVTGPIPSRAASRVVSSVTRAPTSSLRSRSGGNISTTAESAYASSASMAPVASDASKAAPALVLAITCGVASSPPRTIPRSACWVARGSLST